MVHQRIQSQPDGGGRYNDNRLLELLELPQQGRGADGQQGRGEVGNRALGDDDHGARDGADRRRRDAIDEGDDARPLTVLLEIGRRDDGEQVTRQEGSQGRHAGAGQPRHQVADEADGDDHWTGSDHGYRHGIDELLV